MSAQQALLAESSRMLCYATVKLNKLCGIEDWARPSITTVMRRLMPDLVQSSPCYPAGFEHRKVWEYAHVLTGLDHLEALRPDSLILSIGSGHEEPLYDLTNRVRWVFATDIYGQGSFHDTIAPSSMLVNPDQHARCPHNRNRLVVQHMSALDLRFEAATFDVVYSFSTIEHVGGPKEVCQMLSEVSRVLKSSGVAVITTECIVNDAPQLECDGLILFHPDSLRSLEAVAPGLRFMEPIDFSISPATLAKPWPLLELMEAWTAGRAIYPDIVEKYEGRVYTSVCMFFRKDAVS